MAKGQNEDVKAWLSGYRDAKRNLERIQGEYRELISFQESARAITYDAMPGGGGSTVDLSDAMVRRCESIGNITSARMEAERKFGEIQSVVNRLEDNVQRCVISARYLQLKGFNLTPWSEVASMMGYTREHVARIHGDALDVIKEILS